MFWLRFEHGLSFLSKKHRFTRKGKQKVPLIPWFDFHIKSSGRDYSPAWIVTQSSCVHQRPDAGLHASNKYLDNEKYKRKSGGGSSGGRSD